MYAKADFMQKIKELLPSYPSIAALYEAGDPRILMQLEAQATMLAMLSGQIETAQNEQFEKSRDSTVLADAAMRGIIRKGKAARVRILASNTGTQPFQIETARTLLDSSGRLWHIATPAVVQAGGTATFEAVQFSTETISHTVTDAGPFYAVEIPAAEDDSYLYTISVSDGSGVFEYTDRYVNVASGERVFHVEVDDRQRVYVRFGYRNVVGVEPDNGSQLTIVVNRTAGDISIEYGSPFSFEYLQSPQESTVELTMDALLSKGENPISMSQLRDLSRYPSVYDENAVYLGEFDFLVRRNFPTLQFLSVWNECAEEQARGASVDNINCLFVACLSEQGTEKTLTQDADEEVDPERIDDDDLTETQKQIKAKILSADDSYRVKFFTPVISKIRVTISACVSTSYVASEIKEKIIEVMLDQFGVDSASSKRGQFRVLYRRVYNALRQSIPALSDGEADLTVTIQNGDESTRPELWRYVDRESLSVTVKTDNITTPSWGL